MLTLGNARYWAQSGRRPKPRRPKNANLGKDRPEFEHDGHQFAQWEAVSRYLNGGQ